MKKCYICKKETAKPLLAALHHFMLIDFEQFGYLKGTYQTFGFRSSLTLISPFFNTLLHWRHLRKSLLIPGENNDTT